MPFSGLGGNKSMLEELKKQAQEDNAVKPLIELIEAIQDMPDDMPEGMVNGLIANINEELQNKQFVDECIHEMRMLTREQGEEIVSVLNNVLTDLVKELDYTGTKQQILVAVTNRILENQRTAFDIVFNKKENHTLRFERIHPNAKLPTYAHEGDACADLYAPEDITIPADTLGNKVGTGLRCAIPEGFEVQIRPRSGMSMKSPLRISNQIGTVDESFMGEWCVLFDNLGLEDYTIHAGDRIAQVALKPVYRFNSEEVESIDAYKQTNRGNAGFGSSGK